MKKNFQQREIAVLGTTERCTVYSLDGTRWFSSKSDAERCQRRRESFFAEESKLLKRHSTFRPNGTSGKFARG